MPTRDIIPVMNAEVVRLLEARHPTELDIRQDPPSAEAVQRLVDVLGAQQVVDWYTSTSGTPHPVFPYCRFLSATTSVNSAQYYFEENNQNSQDDFLFFYHMCMEQLPIALCWHEIAWPNWEEFWNTDAALPIAPNTNPYQHADRREHIVYDKQAVYLVTLAKFDSLRAEFKKTYPSPDWFDDMESTIGSVSILKGAQDRLMALVKEMSELNMTIPQVVQEYCQDNHLNLP